MKIAYLANWAEGAHSGVISKIQMQVSRWRDMGHRVTIFLVIPEHNRESILEVFRDDPEFRAFTYRSNSRRFFTTIAAVRALMRSAPDVVYARQMAYHPVHSFLGLRIPIVIEVNTNDEGETRLGHWLRHVYHQLSRRLFYSASSGLVCVTHELANSPSFRKFRKPTTVVANGIDLDAVSALPPATNSNATLVFLGSAGQVWHGIDKIITLARQFSNWKFHLVGPSQEDLEVEPPPNIISHGHLRRDEWRDLLAASDIAIGTLALYRKKMDEACPLKVREYLAAGLPVIMAYYDTDFPNDVPFILRLPNDERPINLLPIQKFVEHWHGRRVDRPDISHIGFKTKEEDRIVFLRTLAEAVET